MDRAAKTGELCIACNAGDAVLLNLAQVMQCRGKAQQNAGDGQLAVAVGMVAAGCYCVARRDRVVVGVLHRVVVLVRAECYLSVFVYAHLSKLFAARKEIDHLR